MVSCSVVPWFLPSFPTRRSSDLTVWFRRTDVGEPEQCVELVREVAGEHGSLDVLVNDAVLAGRHSRPLLHTEVADWDAMRSEEHTSELQSRRDLVCRLLLEKKNR